jgi:hypothetical protein
LNQPIKSLQKLVGVTIDTTFTKWGNWEENLLNGVISVKIVKLEGKKWNLLLFYSLAQSTFKQYAHKT